MARVYDVIIMKTSVLSTGYCSTAAYTENRDGSERCSFTVMYLKNPFASALSTRGREEEI